ncbi:F-box protein CPR1-like, partial [Salvia splendens]|uniref:F-box protein CPR1-like n=1 Tax=Salvia splendens TaxID=180675 RepID=UPI001C263E1C
SLTDSSRFYFVDLDSFDQFQVGDARIEPFSVTGSCNGLVLLTPNSGDIILWNPAIRKQLKLAAQPPIPHRFIRDEAIFALGYDSEHDDYKVVSVNQAANDKDGNTFTTETMIYSLKSNSWKKAKDFPYLLPHHTSRWGIYLNGALHTVVKHGRNPEMVIMSFDLGKEEHLEIPLPEHSNAAIRGVESLEVLVGCLAAVVPGKKCGTDIWLMKEYGVKQSWMKLLQLDPPLLGGLRPLAYSKSGGEVLLNDDGMCLSWYDLKKKTVARARVSAWFKSKAVEPFSDTEVVVGSLVWPCVKEHNGPRKGVKEMKIKKGKVVC